MFYIFGTLSYYVVQSFQGSSFMSAVLNHFLTSNGTASSLQLRTIHKEKGQTEIYNRVIWKIITLTMFCCAVALLAQLKKI